MWIEVTDEKDGVLHGIVANEAEATRAVTNGQAIMLNLSEISDWKYTRRQEARRWLHHPGVFLRPDDAAGKTNSDFLKESGVEM